MSTAPSALDCPLHGSVTERVVGPVALRDVAGFRRDSAADDEAHRTAPLHDRLTVHPEAVHYIFTNGRRTFLTTAPQPGVQRQFR